ncbi:MAG: SusF/SusE family outer membrane protein [Bacteroidetes bacterium]|nr:MAG: SusF/SusE family outer membrane protein [Bacteroidota bacterium]
MRNLYIFTGILCAALFLGSCEDVALDPVVNPTTAPTLTSPSAGSVFTLDESQSGASVATFEWTAADFGYSAGITYTLELDLAGNDFADAVTIGVTNRTAFSDLTVGKLNNILLAKGLPFGFENELEIRVCASVSDLVETLCSELVPIKINPYQAEVVYPFLTIPGSYQNWDPADTTHAIYSRKSDGVYEGFIYFGIDDALFKFAQGLSWDTNWGDIEPDGVLDAGGIGNDIPIPDGAGMYFIRCDLNTLTYTVTKTDWGVVGDATPGGWDTDTDLTWDDARQVLTLTTDLSVGEIKFRANDAWDFNFGDDFNNGTLEPDGANIPVTEAGNYTIDLYLTVPDYYYTMTKN